MVAPLEGIRVVEIAHFVAAPSGGALLADLGAEVIKVEVPSGEMYRHVRPQFEVVTGALARAQAAGYVAAGDPAHLFFLVLGSAAMLSQPAQAEMLTGRDPHSPEEVEAYAELVTRVILAHGSQGTREATKGDD